MTTLTVYLEPTDFCNAKCLYCIHETDASPHDRPKGYMTYEMWVRLIDELAAMKADRTITEQIDFRPYWFGESFLHPDYDRMLDYLAQHDFVDQFLLATNGALVDARYADVLLNYAQHRPERPCFITYGIDALEPEIMWTIKRMKKAPAVLDNITTMLDRRATRGVRNLYIIIQMIVMPQNVHHTRAFVEYWRTVLTAKGATYAEGAAWSPAILQDYIWVKPHVAPGAQEAADTLHQQACRDVAIPLIDRQLPTAETSGPPGQPTRKPCGMAWQLTICWDGTVTPCCIDTKCQLAIGNVRHQSLREIYTGQQALQLRLAHLSGDLTRYPRCDQCDCPYLGSFAGEPWITDEKLSRTLKDAARLGLIAPLRR